MGEELRTILEQAERARKAAENELADASDRVNELTAQVSTSNSQKRKLEGDITAMQSDLDELNNELKDADDRAKHALGDATRLADELRQEQDHGLSIEKMRKSLESQVKELQVRLDESEAAALKGGKKMIQKLEGRVRELEAELDSEQRRHAETQKSMRKVDRRVKELSFQQEEDRKNYERMQELVDKLQNKIKTYKGRLKKLRRLPPSISLSSARYSKNSKMLKRELISPKVLCKSSAPRTAAPFLLLVPVPCKSTSS